MARGRATHRAHRRDRGRLVAALAQCSNSASKIDPRYGVSASPRVVEPGEPVPKGGGSYRVGKPCMVAGRVYYPKENRALPRRRNRLVVRPGFPRPADRQRRSLRPPRGISGEVDPTMPLPS